MERRRKHLYKNFFCTGVAVLCCLLLLVPLRFLPVVAQTQTPADPSRDEHDARIIAFFETLRRSPAPAPAFEELLRGSPLGTSEASEPSTELQRKVAEMQTQFGGILAWERLETKRIGTSIALVRYVLMYDRYPVICKKQYIWAAVTYKA